MNDIIGGCSYTRTTLRPGGDWVAARLFDPDIWGDWTPFEAADELLDGYIQDRLDEALEEQAPCACYIRATSEIHVCVAHARTLNTDAAMAAYRDTVDTDFNDWTGPAPAAGTGPLAAIWQRIDAMSDEEGLP